MINYSFELFDFDEALTPYGTLETKTPEISNITIDNFSEGDHFRTGPEENTNHLILQLEDRLISLVIDETGSSTWNDNKGDRYVFAKRLFKKLESTYPGVIKAIIVGFGGVLTSTNMFVIKGGVDFLTEENQDFNAFLKQTFEDSVFDFSGVRIVRRDDRYPEHPADGIVVGDGIFEAIKDDDLQENKEYFYGVWTYNKDNHFSEGKFVKGTPRDRILPSGVNFITAESRILPGVKRDSNTKIIYNFQEKNGYVVFDSSGNGKHGIVNSETILDNFWSGDASDSSYSDENNLKKPVGVKFDGEFDIIEIENDFSTSIIGSDYDDYHGITINIWVFRTSQSNDSWIIGSSSSSPSNNVGWSFGILPNGKVGTKINGDINDGFEEIIDSPVIPENIWTMLTFSVNSDGCITLYVNGTLEVNNFCPVGVDSSINSSDDEKIYIGAKPIDSGATWNGVDYFGSIAQLSISDIERDQNWVLETYNQELKIFNQSINDSNQSPVDNLQREVLLSWQIGADYNYENGFIKIVRKYNSIPSNDYDGDIILEQQAAPGDFFFIDSYDFTHASNYYYRIFTINALQNICDIEEARLTPIFIQKSSTLTEPEPVSEESIIIGNKKLLLQWKNPTNYRGVKIFFSNDQYPTISRSPEGNLTVSDGIEILDTVNSIFVHRTTGKNCDGADITLVNGKRHYYSIVTYDELGNYSEPILISSVPSVDSAEVFPPAEVSNLYLINLNPKTLSVKWQNPTIKNSKLDLYLGETALVFFSIKDIYGGDLKDIKNIEIKTCTKIKTRSLQTSESELDSGSGFDEFIDDFNPRLSCENAPDSTRTMGSFGSEFDENCNSEQEVAETVNLYGQIENGLIKGIITHTNDRAILSRRNGYVMTTRAQYKIIDPDDSEKTLFEFFTQPTTITFTHPIKISAINKRKKFVYLGCEVDGGTRFLNNVCNCNEFTDDECKTTPFNGGYVGAKQPYVCRIELQYKGSALPDGTPINIQLFKHDPENTLKQKSDKTFIREGRYITSAINEEEISDDGESTGNFISKSICDIDITHPLSPDWLDLYVSLDFAGFLVDAIHEIRFIDSLFIRTEISRPNPDGIDVAEQFATVWQVNPDDPSNPDSNIPVPDGTLVKWELIPKRHGLDRPFYSTEPLPILISGVYSLTNSGIARNVFLGPIGNLERHIENITCKDEDGSIISADSCCLSEEYEIKASVIVRDMSARDAVQFGYECEDLQSLTNKRFLLNAAENQPGSNPHWITWADGIHLLKFQIAKNPAISDMLGANCFRQCVEAQVGGQLFTFPEDQVIQISAPGEILWNVIFQEDPYTGELSPISYDSVSPPDDEYSTLTIANIPINGETTDFYLRLNSFVNDANPMPEECEGGGGGDGFGGGGESDPCEWKNICDQISICSPTNGRPWQNVTTVSGTTTLIANNREVTLFGGGDYKDGIPPVYAGFKEPLDVRIIEARINNNRVSELVVDGISTHTFVVEATFAGEPVPDGTRLSLIVEGSNQDVVILSSNFIYTSQINDPLINPTGNQRALAYFDISPLPNIAFSVKINVTCNYDKLGTVNRSITKCIELTNLINNNLPPELPTTGDNTPIETAATSNEEIVYDTINDSYTTSTASLVRRIGHFAISSHLGTVDIIYHFGGFTGGADADTSNITPLSEYFNTTSLTWSFTTDMPTPRCFGMTCKKDETIYCIGGLELDQLLSQYKVSRKIESYDIVTETWNTTLASMPEEYGVAYGDCQIVDDYIYVTCGVNNIIDNSKPGRLNDKILRYSITNDIWETISVTDEFLYKRIGQFGFLRDSVNHIESTTQTETAGSGDIGYVKTSTDTWIPGSILLGYNSSSNFNPTFRWTVELDRKFTVNNATLKLDLTSIVGSGLLDITVNLLDIDNAADQVWSSGGGPKDTPYSASIVFSKQLSGSTTIEIDITDLVNNFINRSNFVIGNYLAIKIDWSGSNISNTQWSGSNARLLIEYELAPKEYYLCGGSIPKAPSEIENERTRIINDLLNKFRSFILTSSYFLNLSPTEQQDFITEKETEIRNSVQVPAFIYPSTGFKFKPGTETSTDDGELILINKSLSSDWKIFPKPRDMGKCVYIPNQDVAYFIGGSNQNNSTTLNRVESIDLSMNNLYSKRSSLSRGRSMFSAVNLTDDIYISGGLTSGHKEGWVQIETNQLPEFVEATGTQSCGIIINLKNDSGELIEDDIRIDIRGKARIKSVDDILVEYTANRAADRALGGDGSGNAPDTPEPGEEIDLDRLRDAQNSIIDPNSDQFQFNAARRLNESVSLFPVLYSKTDIVTNSGIAGTTLLPRSEDPLEDFEKLASFINNIIENAPPDNDERFDGDLTREELIALGAVLSTIESPKITITSGLLRELYDIETIVTILDDFYFGQTISDFDISLQQRINDRIEEILTPPVENPDDPSNPENGGNTNGNSGGNDSNSKDKCFVLEHSAQPDIPSSDTPPSSPDPNNPAGTGGFSQSGQCLFCESILPLNVDIRSQNTTALTKFFNAKDWIPQIKSRLTNGSLTEAVKELDIMDHEIPFGSSQIYDALIETSILSTGDDFEDTKKSIYICSDSSQNLSRNSLSDAIEEINSIDGEKQTPCIYTVFNTSFPVSVTSLLDRSDIGDASRISEETGGQSITLISSSFIDQILNQAIGSASGGLGYGIYTRRIEFNQLSAITSITTYFELPSNTAGYLRFRHSTDGYTFSDFSEKYENSGTFNFTDFFAKVIDFEIVLTTGFTVEISEEYDAISTGVPKLIKVIWETSAEKEDFVFLNKEEVLSNAQQVAMSFEGSSPETSIIELGAATSNSTNWNDYQSTARPSIKEFGKTFLLEREKDSDSIVPVEKLSTKDNILYKSDYGPWDQDSTFSLFYLDNNQYIPVTSGFVTYPRDGEIYFDTTQPPEKEFRISITNNDNLRVGLRIVNRLNNEPVTIEGLGYIYSTNNKRQPSLAQVAPKVSNVTVAPANPTSSDTFFALYQYKDLNNNSESGSLISWYKNSLQLLEIKNKTSWSNQDLLMSHKLVPGDKIQFSITPSDGIDYGTTVFSQFVIVQPRQPIATDIRIVPIRNGIQNNRFDTSSTFKIEYNFSVEDTGSASLEKDTNIKWIINGVTFKEGNFTSGEDDPYFDPKTIEPTEIISGTSAHIIGNQIQVEITPRTSLISGIPSRSQIITVENSKPIATSVQIDPLLPNTQSTLRISYAIDDRDITINVQSDRSEIKWFNSSTGTDNFTEVTELRASKTVPSFYLRTGQVWKAQIQPYDGLDLGQSVFSNTVQIS